MLQQTFICTCTLMETKLPRDPLHVYSRFTHIKYWPDVVGGHVVVKLMQEIREDTHAVQSNPK